MNKIKIFLNPIEGREEYLNHIASEGYRLVKSGSIIHEFEKTNSDHRYAVEYIGYMNNKERKKYTEFLNGMNLKVFTAPLNIGKLSFGNIKLRPYNSPKSMIATSPGMINKEILIIETESIILEKLCQTDYPLNKNKLQYNSTSSTHSNCCSCNYQSVRQSYLSVKTLSSTSFITTTSSDFQYKETSS